MIEKWTSPQNMEHFAVNRLQAQTGGPLSLSLSLHMDGYERILGTKLCAEPTIIQFTVCNHVRRRPRWWSIQIFFRRVYMRMEYNSQRREMLYSCHQHGRRDFTYKPAIGHLRKRSPRGLCWELWPLFSLILRRDHDKRELHDLFCKGSSNESMFLYPGYAFHTPWKSDS